MALKPTVEVGDILLYYNNNQPALPCIVETVRDEAIVDVLLWYPTGNVYRSGLNLWRGEQSNYSYPGGEYVMFRKKDIGMEKQYPLNPDLW